MEEYKTVLGISGGSSFRKLIKSLETKRTPEEREFIDKYKELEAENIFYKTSTVAKSSRREVSVDVKLYRRIHNTKDGLKVMDNIILSFGSPREYNFSQDFVDRNRPLAVSGEHKGFDLNIGEGLYVSNEEFVRILDDCVEVLKEKGLPLSEGY